MTTALKSTTLGTAEHAPTSCQTVVLADCPNCDGEILVDVTMQDTGERPPLRAVEWMLAIGDNNRVECRHCRHQSTRRELELHSDLNETVQSHAALAFRAPRSVEANDRGLRMDLLFDRADAKRKGYE